MQTDLNPHFSHYNARRALPSSSQLKVIDGFSVEHDRSFCKDSRKYLKYLRLPDPGSFAFDLNVGYESYVPGIRHHSLNLNTLIEYIDNKKEDCGDKFTADFITRRGLLVRIMTTPYIPNDSWSVVATKYRGTIYLCKSGKINAEEEPRSDRHTYYGKNIERFIFTGELQMEPR